MTVVGASRIGKSTLLGHIWPEVRFPKSDDLERPCTRGVDFWARIQQGKLVMDCEGFENPDGVKLEGDDDSNQERDQLAWLNAMITK